MQVRSAFANIAAATEALRARLAAQGIPTSPWPAGVSGILGEAGFVFMPGVDAEAAKSSLINRIKRDVPTSPPMLRVVLVAWVNELLGTAGSTAAAAEPAYVEPTNMLPPLPPPAPEPTVVKSGFANIAAATEALRARFAGAGIAPWPPGVQGILNEAAYVFMPGVDPIAAKSSLFNRIKRDVPTSPPVLPFILTQWVNELLGTAGGSGYTAVGDSAPVAASTNLLIDVAAALVNVAPSGGSQPLPPPPAPQPVLQVQREEISPPPQQQGSQPLPYYETEEYRQMLINSKAASAAKQPTVVQSVTDAGKQAAQVVQDAITPPATDKPILFGLTAKQLGVAGAGLGLLWFLGKR